MQLVMLYSEDGESGNILDRHYHVYPIHYESAEKAHNDFRQACEACSKLSNRMAAFMFCGMEFYAENFLYGHPNCLPRFLTVDEWFDEQGSQA